VKPPLVGAVIPDMLGVRWCITHVVSRQNLLVGTPENGPATTRRWWGLNGRFLEGGTCLDLQLPRGEDTVIDREPIKLTWIPDPPVNRRHRGRSIMPAKRDHRRQAKAG
jgi:hypothetical protein